LCIETQDGKRKAISRDFAVVVGNLLIEGFQVLTSHEKLIRINDTNRDFPRGLGVSVIQKSWRSERKAGLKKNQSRSDY